MAPPCCRQTFPVTVGAIQFISYVGSDGRGSLVAIVPQLLLSLSVQKYIVRGLTGHPAYTASRHRPDRAAARPLHAAHDRRMTAGTSRSVASFTENRTVCAVPSPKNSKHCQAYRTDTGARCDQGPTGLPREPCLEWSGIDPQ